MLLKLRYKYNDINKQYIRLLFFFQIRIVISADAPHTELFVTHQDNDFSDEHRMLMDDLSITQDSVSHKLIFIYLSLVG